MLRGEVSNSDQLPGNGQGLLVECHPCPAGGGTAARTAERPRVEDAGQTDDFVARDMRVAVEEEICSADTRWRDVNEKKSFTGPFEEQLGRQIEAPVIVTEYPIKGPAERLEGIEGLLIAIVPEVPNLVGLSQLACRRGRKPIVRVGNDGDQHRQC